MRKREVLLFLLLGTLMLSGCNKKTGENTQQNTTESSDAVGTSITEIDTSNMFSDRDKEVGYEESESVAISLADDSSVCESDAVVITENTVTIKEEILLSKTAPMRYHQEMMGFMRIPMRVFPEVV